MADDQRATPETARTHSQYFAGTSVDMWRRSPVSTVGSADRALARLPDWRGTSDSV